MLMGKGFIIYNNKDKINKIFKWKMIPNKIEYGTTTGMYCMTQDVKMQHSTPNVSSNKKQPTTFTLIAIVLN